MIFWLDAQLPPRLARYLEGQFGIKALPLRELQMRDADDRAIFDAARVAGATVVTKDSDFAELVQRLGPPPQIVWVTVGNASNAHLQSVFGATFADAIKLLEAGTALVEIAETGSS